MSPIGNMCVDVNCKVEPVRKIYPTAGTFCGSKCSPKLVVLHKCLS